MGTHIHRRLAAGVSVAALSLLPALAAVAQDTAADGATLLEAITVTGEKVSRDMKAKGIRTLEDYYGLPKAPSY